jgi:hypothetical protein
VPWARPGPGCAAPPGPAANDKRAAPPGPARLRRVAALGRSAKLGRGLGLGPVTRPPRLTASPAESCCVSL